MLKQTSFLAILAIGFALALITAELDLSFAEVASLAAVVAGYLVHKGDPVRSRSRPGSASASRRALSTGCWSPAAHAVADRDARHGRDRQRDRVLSTQGVAFVGRWPAAFTGLARGSVLGVPALILWTGGRRADRRVRAEADPPRPAHAATGEADEAARLAGVATARMKLIGLALSGLFAGLVAVLLAANLTSAAPNMARDYLLSAIAAVLLGMTMFEPGRCQRAGHAGRRADLEMLGNGLVLMGAAYYVQDIMLGFIIVGSVALSATALKKAAFAV